MPGSILGPPQVQQDPQGGIALTWVADVPAGETVLYYTVNVYNATTNKLVNTVQLQTPVTATLPSGWDISDWDQGVWEGGTITTGSWDEATWDEDVWG